MSCAMRGLNGQAPAQYRRWARRGCGVLAVALGLSLMTNGAANALPHGLSISAAPTVDYIMWDDDLGLEDVALYGGRLSLNFGRLVALQGHYFTNDNVDTDLRSIRYDGNEIAFDRDQELRVNRYGGDLMLSLGFGQAFVPFIKVGGGIMQFRPDEGNKFDVIALNAGGGIRFAFLDRLQAQVHVEDVMFRLDRRHFIPAASDVLDGLPVDPDRDDIRHNLTFGGGLIFNLGGHSPDQESDLDRAIRSRYDGGLFGASWPVEFYVGQVKFDPKAGLEDQAHAGVRTGLNFGQLVGLRGYYWRGIADDFGRFEDVQSYGGEAQFNLNSGQGAIPYLLLGAGQLDFLSDYRDESGNERADRTMLIAGGGLGFTLGRHFRVNAAVRDYIFTESESSQLAEPEELLHNWSYSAGLTFLFGGRRADRGEVDALGRERWPIPPPTPAQRGDVDRDGERDQEYGSWRRDGESPERYMRPRDYDRRPKTEYILLPDSLLPRNMQSDRVIGIPVPEVGEIYIRYGEPGGVTIQSTPSSPVTLPPDTVFKTAPKESMTDDERLELLSRNLEERLGDRLEKRIDERFKSLPQTAPGSTSQTIVVPSSPSTTVVQGADGSQTTVTPSDPKVFHTYAGINLDQPTQLILGLRLDIGSIAHNRSLRFVPELAFGFMNEGSFMIAGNALYNFGPIPGTDRIAPYAYGGLGLIRFGEGVERDRTEGVFNLGYGISKPIGRWAGFIEHQGIDLFSLNRINAGIRWIKK